VRKCFLGVVCLLRRAPHLLTPHLCLLCSYARLIGDVCDELDILQSWLFVGLGFHEATGASAAHDTLFPFPHDMKQAEQAAWVGLVRSVCREDASLVSALVKACSALDDTLLELFVLDMAIVARRFLLKRSRRLLAARLDAIRSSELVVNTVV